MLAAADLGKDTAGRGDADPHQLSGDVARQGLLVEAVGCVLLGWHRAVADEGQQQVDRILHCADFVAPVVKLHRTLRLRHLQPVVVLREVEIECTAGDAAALHDTVQELVATQSLAELAADVTHPLAGLLQVLQDVCEAVGIDTRAVGHAGKRLPVAFEFLQQLRFDVRTRQYIGDIEQRRHRGSRMPFRAVRRMELELLKQARQPQPGPALLVQRVLEDRGVWQRGFLGSGYRLA